MQAFQSKGTEILFGGATEGGKSHFARVMLVVLCLAIPGLQCVLIRKKYDDILKNHVEGPTGFKLLLAPLIEVGQVKVTDSGVAFPRGSNIAFQHCFTGDTLILTTDGPKEIKSLVGTTGTVRVTKSFTAKYRNVRLTRESASTVLVAFDDGSHCRCTPDHRFITERGPVEARHLAGVLCLTNESSLSIQQLRYLRESDTVNPANITQGQAAGCIGSCGSCTTAQSRRASRSITRTEVPTITRSKTWKCSTARLIEGFTQALKNTGSRLGRRLLTESRTLATGTERPQGMSGTNSKFSKLKNACSIKSANHAAQSIRGLRSIEVAAGSVGDGFTELKRKRCVSVQDASTEDVYCLTVPDCGAFPLANGVLVSNCQDERQFASAQGVEKHVLVIDEATQISERLIQFFRAWVRMPKEMKAALPPEYRDKLPLILYTANPIGPSAGYFRREFVKSRAAFAVEKVHGFLRQYIPSRAQDNPSVDMEAHQGRLSGLGDDALARALDEGDWDAPVGEFITEYKESINGEPHHVVPDFRPPAHWFKFRGHDWGHAEPFCTYWAAVSDGVEFTDEKGRRRWFRAGCLVIYREWYGCDPDSPAKGLGITNVEIAKGIAVRTTESTSNITVTDSLPFQRRGGELIADEYARNGCPLTLGNTDRVIGWKRYKDYLLGIDGYPMLVICECCVYLREYIPALQRHKTKPEDAVEHGEATHANDTVRIMVMTRPPIKYAPTPPLHKVVEPVRISASPNGILKQLSRQTKRNGRI